MNNRWDTFVMEKRKGLNYATYVSLRVALGVRARFVQPVKQVPTLAVFHDHEHLVMRDINVIELSDGSVLACRLEDANLPFDSVCPAATTR